MGPKGLDLNQRCEQAETAARSGAVGETTSAMAYKSYRTLPLLTAFLASLAGVIEIPTSDVLGSEVQDAERGSTQQRRLDLDKEGPTTRPGRKKLFQPGVWVNWSTRQVEVAGEVVLRSGPLELFACSPDTKEHESIVRVLARPLHIYQALGLIGLEPGHPPYYDERKGRQVAAFGARLELLVQWTQGGKTRAVPIERWMLDTKRNRAMKPGKWVFAGSGFLEGGDFLADFEGTVVTVVDFYSALISLATSHSEANEALWLAANTSQIPPEGTQVRLIIRPANERLVMQLDRFGRLWHGQRAITLRDAFELVRSSRAPNQTPTAVIEHEPEVAEVHVRQLVQVLQHAGLADVTVQALEWERSDRSYASGRLASIVVKYGPAILGSLADFSRCLPSLAQSAGRALKETFARLRAQAISAGQGAVKAAQMLSAKRHQAAER